MGMPSINIVFRTAAATLVRRSQRGVIGAILKDSAEGVSGVHTLMSAKSVPVSLSEVNQDYLKKAFIGYVNQPQKVIVYVLAANAENLKLALDYFATQKINYIVGPPDCTEAEALEIAAWVKTQREDKKTYKAVLPDTAADNEGIVNFTTSAIKADGKTYTAAGYCGRMAGILAGTPVRISSTFAALPEVTDVDRLSEADMDEAVDAGKLLIFHDGEKVKTGRAVNSLQTVAEAKGTAFKKIKIVDAVDMMRDDIRLLAQDNYIGKYPNSYDNKCLLITAIQEYFAKLEAEGVLGVGASSVEIDLDAVKKYLEESGTDPYGMTDQEIKAADTGSHVLLKGTVQVLDTIEDINLDMSF